MHNRTGNLNTPRRNTFSLTTILDKCSSLFDNRPTRFARQIVADRQAEQSRIKVVRSGGGTYYSWSAD